MESLPWLIYLADVAGTAESFLGYAFVATSVVFAFCFAVGGFMRLDRDEDFNETGERLHDRLASLLWLPIGLPVLLIFIPSSNTIYAIAASEIGQDFIETETAGKALKALDAWLDQQIAPDGEGD